MPLFLDASAWAKLYVLDENGSEAMQAVFARPELGDKFFASRCVAIEMLDVFAERLRVGKALAGERGKHLPKGGPRRNLVRRYRRGVRLKYREALQQFAQDVRESINFVAIQEGILEDALNRAGRAPEKAVHAMDWIHLSTAVHLSSRLKEAGVEHDVVMIACDHALLSASRAAGLDTWNPETDPPTAIGSPSLI